MTNTWINVHALKGMATCRLALPCRPLSCACERHELRNYMKDAALCSDLKKAAARDSARRDSEIVVSAAKHFDFRILKIEA